MNKQEMIEAIYKEIANKEISIWCKVKVKRYFTKYNFNDERNFLINWIFEINGDWFSYGEFRLRKAGGNIMSWELRKLVFNFKWEERKNKIPKKDNNNKWIDFIEEVIWHPVLIWDVLDYMTFNNPKQPIKTELSLAWEFKRLPIEEQSAQCITYIYNLITNG